MKLKNSQVRIITSNDKEGLEVIRHDAPTSWQWLCKNCTPELKLQLAQLLKMVFTMILRGKSLLQAMI